MKTTITCLLVACCVFSSYSQTCDIIDPNYQLPGGGNACTMLFGSTLFAKTSNFDCHQYVRGALVGALVDLATGNLKSGVSQSSFMSYCTGTIINDNNFIKVCSINDAQAAVPVGHGADHSALRVGTIWACTPGATDPSVYTESSPLGYTTTCDYEMYACISNITLSGSSAVNIGMDATYTLLVNGSSTAPLPSYIISEDRWVIDSHFTITSRTNRSITIRSATGVTSGTFTDAVKTSFRTSCAVLYPLRKKTVSVMPDCSGTLNGGPLYTFNTAHPSGPNYVVMNQSSWTWVKTQGQASYSTGSGGKTMTFTLNSGCSTFNAYGSGCNVNFTFCPGSMRIATEEPLVTIAPPVHKFHVIDITGIQIVKEGVTQDPDDTKTMLEGLPSGVYVINVAGERKKFLKLP